MSSNLRGDRNNCQYNSSNHKYMNLMQGFAGSAKSLLAILEAQEVVDANV